MKILQRAVQTALGQMGQACPPGQVMTAYGCRATTVQTTVTTPSGLVTLPGAPAAPTVPGWGTAVNNGGPRGSGPRYEVDVSRPPSGGPRYEVDVVRPPYATTVYPGSGTTVIATQPAPCCPGPCRLIPWGAWHAGFHRSSPI